MKNKNSKGNVVYTPAEGETIEGVAHKIVLFANLIEAKIVALFDNVELYANPNTDPQEIVDYFKQQISKE